MTKLSHVDVFKCDSCGKEVIASTHDIVVKSKYCGVSDFMSVNQENLENAEFAPSIINTIQLPYVYRDTINIQNRDPGMDIALGGVKAQIANEVKTTTYHICDECMNKIEEDFIDIMNASSALQEKYFDSCFH